jgi:hypothetical protein
MRQHRGVSYRPAGFSGRVKNLPEWIATCNAHPDKNMCEETIKIISDNQKQVPPELKCE